MKEIDIKLFSKKDIHYALFGNLLGDGYLRKNKTTTHWVESVHTNKQRDYVVWLKGIYESWGLKTFSRMDYLQKTNYGDYMYSLVRCKMGTNRHVDHNRLFNINNKKYISKYIMYRINVFGLLLWWLDDGSLTIHKKKNESIARFGSLGTQQFDYSSQLKIQEMFKNRFDIDVSIYRTKKTMYYIYFNATNFRKFYDLVRMYLDDIPDSMKYKFNMKYVKNRVNSESLLAYNLLTTDTKLASDILNG